MRKTYYQVEWAKRFDSTRRMVEKMQHPRRARSLNTIKQYCHAVLLFTRDFLKVDSPDKALEIAKKDVRGIVDKYLDYLLVERKQAPKTVRPMFFGLKYWLECNDVDVSPLKDVELPKSTITVTEDRKPTKEELRQLYDFGNIRDKALLEIAISSGLRINTIATLKLKDVVWNPYELLGVKRDDQTSPAMINVKPRMGRKASKSFFTFITPEAKRVLRQYIEFRRRMGEQITEDSPLIGSIYGIGKERNFPSDLPNVRAFGEHVSAETLLTAWKRLLKKSGLSAKSHKWHELHFHTLRKFFETECINAGVKRAYLEFWMGHKGAYLDDSYFRANLKEHLAEYEKAIPSLSIMEVEKSVSEIEIRKKGAIDNIRMLIALGVISETQGEAMINTLQNVYSRDQLENFIKDRLSRWLQKKEKSKDCQKLVSERELPRYLAEGWKVQAVLPSGKIVISNE